MLLLLLLVDALDIDGVEGIYMERKNNILGNPDGLIRNNPLGVRWRIPFRDDTYITPLLSDRARHLLRDNDLPFCVRSPATVIQVAEA